MLRPGFELEPLVYIPCQRSTNCTTVKNQTRSEQLLGLRSVVYGFQDREPRTQLWASMASSTQTKLWNINYTRSPSSNPSRDMLFYFLLGWLQVLIWHVSTFWWCLLTFKPTVEFIIFCRVHRKPLVRKQACWMLPPPSHLTNYGMFDSRSLLLPMLTRFNKMYFYKCDR